MRQVWLPTVASYLLREFGRTLLVCLGAFVALYLCVDFFERFPGFLGHGASPRLMAFYFALKIPQIITEMMPVAVLGATLLSLGALAKRSELMAMRSCGISLWQIGVPVVAAGLGLSLTMLAWGEYVVPRCTMRAHYVDHVEIKKKEFKGHFNQAEIWYHGRQSFTNIERFDIRGSQVFGVKRYEFDDQFRLRRIVEVGSATWTGSEWTTDDAVEILLASDGTLETKPLAQSGIDLEGTPDDFGAVQWDPDDLSYRSLSREIADLRRKGIDTTDATVGLWLKLAVPFVSVVMVLIAVPLASRHSRNAGVAASVGVALLVGFSFWVVLALTTSLGRSGVLPAPVAAWSANVVFATIGAIFFLSAE
jgi:lipopolysaccharide export system permease protein